MKALAMLVLSAGLMVFALGCYATPGYSAGMPRPTPIDDPMTGTHASHILRNWGIDGLEATDDLDHVLMIDSPSLMSRWDIQ